MKNTFTSTCILVFAITISFGQQLDPTFNLSGYHEYDIGNTTIEGLNKVVITDDGKILNAGTSGQAVQGINGMTTLSKLNIDGSLDLSFNGSGSKIIDFDPGDEMPSDMKLQSDGKIVMTVNIEGTGGNSIADFYTYLARLNADGNFDSTFGTNGKVKIDSAGDYANNLNSPLAFTSSGKIITAHSYYASAFQNYISVHQFNTDGSIDSTFGTNGRTIFGYTGYGDSPRDIVLQADGKIIILGDAYNPSGAPSPNNTLTDILVARLNSNGTFDSSFASNGIYTTTVGLKNDRANKVLIQDDGKILVSGRTQMDALGSDYDIFTLRLLSTGIEDMTYGNSGFSMYTGSTTFPYDHAHGMLLQDDGKIVIASSLSKPNQHADFILARLLDDGTMDSSFAVNGLLITDMVMAEVPKDMLFQPDGKLVVSGVISACIGCPSRNITYRFIDVNPITGFDQTQEIDPIRVYPNPANNYFQIDFSGRISQVSLYNASGQLVTVANNTKTIDISGISSGLYMYRISDDKGKLYSGKLIVE